MTVRMDSQLKQSFDQLCAQFGMSANTAMNIFANAVVVYRKIPFEIKAPRKEKTMSGLSAFWALREEAKNNGLQGMSLEDINEEIRQTRLDMQEQKETPAEMMQILEAEHKTESDYGKERR